ncbi:ABC transporter, ATP-binding protein [Parvimonas sp. KA00067]|uniref:energy-coupling factor transporter ATPase n=1 Tax=Parvimonas sp. KA00067 TaxID=1588755 RepID=UPI0007974510|nr:energy-coupling factor transporter ATPase [Parvimonas sp. KA00067]KXB66533.1 ABC transporter, ATP-binding protein [Parvimonas sp. KA00067]
MNEKIIDIKNLRYEYLSDDNKKSIGLDGISFSVNKGELISILGHNGSGKSTLAKLLNAQFVPTDGEIEIFGINTKDEEKIWDIRQKCAMVFQNPDNQLVATVVEEDVAFGPENLGIDPVEIRQRVDEALEIVEMGDYKKHSPHMLSGGQKQRIAIAGVLSMKPEVIIFDESTAMLDPIGRKDIIDTILKLNKEENKTILYITHYMEEAVLADRVIVLNEGKIEFDDSPKKVFSNVERLRELGLSVPQVTELSYLLKNEGIEIPTDILTNDEMIEFLEKKLK